MVNWATVGDRVNPGLGPRTVGGVYFAGAPQRAYRVDAIHLGQDVSRVLAAPVADWAITITYVETGDCDQVTRVECAPWDPARDYVIYDPAR